MKKVLLLIAVSLLMLGCTDASMSRISSYGNSAKITCYSGGKIIYEGRSTGKIKSETSSDGYFFKDASDNLLKEVSGNCVIAYDK